MRLFYAIGLWGLLDLTHLRKTLDDLPQLRWVAPERVHITLSFLGEVSADVCKDAAETLKDVAANYAPFTLKWQGVGSFPLGRPPRVLWVGLDDLSARQVIRMSKDLGNRRPAPHVTVARVKGVLPDEAVERWQTVECAWPQVRVTQIQLVESKLTPTGPIYTIVASEKLRARGSCPHTY